MIENYYESLSENAFADVIKATFSLNNIYHILDGYSQRERFVIDFNRWLSEASEESVTEFVKQLDGIQLAAFIKTLYEVSSKLKQPILDAILSKEMLDKNHGYKNGYGRDETISPIRFLILEKGNVDLFNALDKKFPMDKSSLYADGRNNYLHLAAENTDVELIKRMKGLGLMTCSDDYHDVKPFNYFMNKLVGQLEEDKKIASLEEALSALKELSYKASEKQDANEPYDSDSDSYSDNIDLYEFVLDEHTELLLYVFEFIQLCIENDTNKSVREKGSNYLLALVTSYFDHLKQQGNTPVVNPIHLVLCILGMDSIDAGTCQDIIDLFLKQFKFEFDYSELDKNLILEKIKYLFDSINVHIVPTILKEDKALFNDIAPKLLWAAAIANNREVCLDLLKMNTPIKQYPLFGCDKKTFYPSQLTDDKVLKSILGDYELKLMKQVLDKDERGGQQIIAKSSVAVAKQTFFTNLHSVEHESTDDAKVSTASRHVKYSCAIS
jgi:hypothetical protein